MKTKILCLFVLLLTLNGCNDDEPKNEPDFSVLGIKNIAINDLVIGLDASGLPKKNNNNTFVIVGMTVAHSSISYELVVVDEGADDKHIAVESAYDDALSVVEKNSVNPLKYTVTISRPGFKESIVYEISFLRV